MEMIALVASATISCSDARRHNLELALEWEHRARVERARLEACEARDALPREMISTPAPPPAVDWMTTILIGGIALGVGLVAGIALAAAIVPPIEQ